MAVSFKTPVTATGTGSLAFALSGLTTGQPIVLFFGWDLLLGTFSVADTFSTHYTWTTVKETSTSACVIGTGGAGTSGTVTVTLGGAFASGGVAVACVGASTAPGTGALDRALIFGGAPGSTSLEGTAEPSVAGDGALYAVFLESTATTITTSPGSPWTDTAVTGLFGRHAGLARTTSPTVGSLLAATWDFSASSAAAYAILIKEAQVPTPPTAVVAVAGDGEATASFAAPAHTGGASITDYTVTANPGGVTKTQNSRTITVTGLTNGVTYTFTVKATNSSGNSTASAPSNAVTPGTVPGAPVLSGGAATAAAFLTWDPPTTDGGAPILGYYVFEGTSAGGESATPVSPGLITGTSLTITGLTNATTYYFKVEAVNAWGFSSASNEVSVVPAVALSVVTPPTLIATIVQDPTFPGRTVVNLRVTNEQAPVTGALPTALVTILRTDGTYVLGASPSTPIIITVFGERTPLHATVRDRSAPYGVPSTYTAFLTYGGATGASAAQSVVMPQAPDTTALYGRLGWAKSEDATGQLLAWLSGIGDMIQAVDSLSTDGFDLEGHSAPGWSQVLDIDRCPTEALPWLAQFLGVRLNPNLRDDQQRFAIKNPQGFGRGTPAAIIAAANLYLSPGYTALLAERDTGVYHLTLRIPTVAIAGLSTCESVWLEYQTCSALAAAFAACSTLWKIPEEITVSVKAAIPAGLAYTISYD